VPIEDAEILSRSWTIVSPRVAVKVMDKSAFLHHGTGIPIDIRRFFDIEDFESGQRKKLTLIYEDKQYDASIVFDKMEKPRSRLFWSIPLSNVLKLNFNKEYLAFMNSTEIKNELKMKFVKHSNQEYEIMVAEEFKLRDLRISSGEFNFSTFNNSMQKREYQKGKETKFYILTVKDALNIQPPNPTYSYSVYILENHIVVSSKTITNRDNKNLLTSAKQEGVQLLLEYNPSVKVEETTLVHYKQDRPNGEPWQKDLFSILHGLFNSQKRINYVLKMATVLEDLEAEKAEEDTFYSEGAVINFYGKRYERKPAIRQRAIEIHGTKCVACDFDFDKKYGAHGKDFIEVHHFKPLSSIGVEVEINPEEDLVPLCSNCHRMIHRKKDNVLSIEQLKELIRNNDGKIIH